MVEFHCFIPKVAESMPIVRSKDIKFDWWEKALDSHRQSPRPLPTTKCAGMRGVFELGWIQRTYQDIEITTKPDHPGFVSKTPYQQEKFNDYVGEYVSDHAPSQLHDIKPLPPGTLPTIIKIHSPWFVTIPEGYSLLLMPVPYNDDNRFTAATGVLKMNNYWNVQMYWHSKPGKHIIKAGTPVQQAVLVKNEQVDFQVKVVDDTKQFLKDNYPFYDKYLK